MQRFKTIKDIAKDYQISRSVLYAQIKTDPSFPAVNIGLKKKYLIDEPSFNAWIKAKQTRHCEFEGEELLRRFKQ